MNLLKNVVPKLYLDIKNNFQIHHPELITQLDDLVITSVCDCGECSQFFCMNIAEKDLALRPLYYDMHNMPLSIMYGLSDNRLIGFEIIHDYDDYYILNQLKNFGFITKN